MTALDKLGELTLIEDALDMIPHMTKKQFIECAHQERWPEQRKAWDAAVALTEEMGSRRKAINHVHRLILKEGAS